MNKLINVVRVSRSFLLFILISERSTGMGIHDFSGLLIPLVTIGIAFEV